MAWGKWTAVVGGLAAIVGGFMAVGWLVYIGGALAVIGGFGSQ